MTSISSQEAVRAIIAGNPEKLPADIAAELSVSELEVVSNLPENMVTLLDGSLFEKLTEEFRSWGELLTVIDVDGHIFELSGPFPKGGMKFGYYNMSDKNTPLKGHLKLDGYSKIALVSKPFHGVDTKSVQFFSHSGNTVFKLYIRRNKDKSFVAEQLEKFEALKQLAA
ncbi:MAG: heme utilization cystosolic carrier protein HutX [Endozoicomonas sp.]|uniref:heme utilization cystosolic carrier protein HutX n=1 Tax=Endozoicomonas sp. TaxID=1892382 RepID=UPI003D9B4129